MRGRKALAVVLLAAAAVFTASTVSADVFEGSIFLLDPNNPLANTNNGSYFPGPFGTVTIDRTSSTTANITFEALTNGDFQYLFMDGNSAGLVLSSTDVTVSNLTGTTLNSNFTSPCASCIGNGDPSLTYEIGLAQVDGVGDYNFRIQNFDGYNWALETISFTLTLNSGTWDTAKSVIDNTQNVDTYLDSTTGLLVTRASWVEGHIAVCDTTLGTCSPSIAAVQTGFAGGAAGPSRVAEPATAILMGAGFLVAGVVGRRLKVRG